MKKILLVDDIRSFLDLEISFLKRAECKIFTALDGAEAVKVAKKEKPDIILLDLVMPRMDGIQATRILKADPETKDIPIVIVTSTEKKEEALKAGANYFLRKPVNERMILDVIKKFVDIKEREEERVDASLKVIINKGGREIIAYTKDISTKGAFLITEEKFPIGLILPLDIELDEGRGVFIKTKAEVVREEREEIGERRVGGIGVKFVELSPEDEKVLSEYLNKLTRSKV